MDVIKLGMDWGINKENKYGLTPKRRPLTTIRNKSCRYDEPMHESLHRGLLTQTDDRKLIPKVQTGKMAQISYIMRYNS